MRKILIIYANKDFPMRKTVKSYLHSFKRYSHDLIFYHNDLFFKYSFLLNRLQFDAVIFHHSITTPWHRQRYLKKLKRYQQLKGLQQAYKIGLFQDEYFNTDLRAQFVNTLALDKVYTVAPESEWSTLYPQIAPQRIEKVLTGYIDPQDLSQFPSLAEPRSVDIGYRTDWTPAMYRTGLFGFKKYEIARKILDSPHKSSLNLNVKIGRSHFLKGQQWFEFLRTCRYVLGAESGSSLHDYDGSVAQELARLIQSKTDFENQDILNTFLARYDNSLGLKAISPRHLEAIVHQCGQILLEGEYNGILKAGRHYLALKHDYSNLQAILEAVKDETQRKTMVENAYQEIALNPKYHYPFLVQNILNQIPQQYSLTPFDRILNQVFQLQDRIGQIGSLLTKYLKISI